jgi:anti-anti-sigma factor
LKSQFNKLDLPSLGEVVFDFGKVSYIGSAGIGKFLLFYKKLALNGLNLKIINVSEDVYELLCLLKLDNVFNISR